MKTLYFDCGMGAAGDMLMASLYEICPDKERFLKMMNEMGPVSYTHLDVYKRQV